MMVKLLKVLACLCLLAGIVALARSMQGMSGHGWVDSISLGTVTVNGQAVHGLPKVLANSVGLLAAVVATVVALLVAGLALAGSGIVVIGVMALVALILVGVAVPFLLPAALPVGLIVYLLTRNRRGALNQGAR